MILFLEPSAALSGCMRFPPPMITWLGFSCRHQLFDHILNQLAAMLLTAVGGLLAGPTYLLPNGKILFQSSFMLMTVQPSASAASSALSSLPTLDSRS
jgi:hypothetical protein